MIEVGRRGDVSINILEPSDVNRRTALDIMRIQGSAVAARFAHLAPRHAILDEIAADYENEDDDHIRVTRDNLANGEEQGWYWAVAKLGGKAVSFALYTDRSDSVHLAELHTVPEAQGQRLASAVALAGLRRLRRMEGHGGNTPVSLVVAREHIGDEAEHPYKLYRELGFVTTSHTRIQHVGDGVSIAAWQMETSIGLLDAALQERVDIDLTLSNE
jgi:GNAT superfamily N-acetyltransferase